MGASPPNVTLFAIRTRTHSLSQPSRSVRVPRRDVRGAFQEITTGCPESRCVEKGARCHMPLIHREPPRGTRTNRFGNERIASAPSQNSGFELGGLRGAEIGRQNGRGAEYVPPGQQRLRVTPWHRLLCLAATRIPFSFLGARLRSHGWLGCGFEPCPMMIGRRWLADYNAGPHPSGTHPAPTTSVRK